MGSIHPLYPSAPHLVFSLLTQLFVISAGLWSYAECRECAFFVAFFNISSFSTFSSNTAKIQGLKKPSHRLQGFRDSPLEAEIVSLQASLGLTCFAFETTCRCVCVGGEGLLWCCCLMLRTPSR